MSEITVIALDAMGGDNAPGEMVKGAVDALGREQDIKVYLLGKEDMVNAELQKYTYDKNRLEVVNTTEVIETAEPPVNAIRRKKDSSIVVGMKMVKEGKADAFVSAGSSGIRVSIVGMPLPANRSLCFSAAFLRMDTLYFSPVCVSTCECAACATASSSARSPSVGIAATTIAEIRNSVPRVFLTVFFNLLLVFLVPLVILYSFAVTFLATTTNLPFFS